jgi:hypothetical protein
VLNGGEVENIMDLVHRHLPKAHLSYRESRVLPVVAKGQGQLHAAGRDQTDAKMAANFAAFQVSLKACKVGTCKTCELRISTVNLRNASREICSFNSCRRRHVAEDGAEHATQSESKATLPGALSR